LWTHEISHSTTEPAVLTIADCPGGDILSRRISRGPFRVAMFAFLQVFHFCLWSDFFAFEMLDSIRPISDIFECRFLLIAVMGLRLLTAHMATWPAVIVSVGAVSVCLMFSHVCQKLMESPSSAVKLLPLHRDERLHTKKLFPGREIAEDPEDL
jgi:hypothetical protein